MAFHRLTVPTYFGGLPGGYDYINNALVGSSAPADGQKAGGPNDGTYFIAFGEDATSSNSNRPNQALAENADFLDNVVRRNLAIPAIKTIVLGAPTDRFTLTGDIYVGMPGTVENQVTRNGLVAVHLTSGGYIQMPAVIENPAHFYTPVLPTNIDNGAGTSVVGDPSPPGDLDGFYTDPRVILNVTLPAGTYAVVCYERANVVTQPEGLVTRLNEGNNGYNELVSWIYNNTQFYPDGTAWHDGTTNPADTLRNQLDKVVTDLIADAGSDRIGSNVVAGGQLALAAGDSIFDQLTDIIDFINLMLESRSNIWGGTQEFNGIIKPNNQITEIGADLLDTAAHSILPRMSMSFSSSFSYTQIIEYLGATTEKIRSYGRSAQDSIFLVRNAYVDTAGNWHYDDDTKEAIQVSFGSNQNNLLIAFSPPSLTHPFDNEGQWLDIQLHRPTIGGSPIDLVQADFCDVIVTLDGLDEAINPPYNNTSYVKNTLWAKNIAKAWASIRTTAGPIAVEGFNIASASLPGAGFLQVDFVEPFSSTNYSIVGSIYSTTKFATLHCVSRTLTQAIFMGLLHTVGAPPVLLDFENDLGNPDRVDIHVFGEQPGT
jgi:hypothetical protein